MNHIFYRLQLTALGGWTSAIIESDIRTVDKTLILDKIVVLFISISQSIFLNFIFFWWVGWFLTCCVLSNWALQVFKKSYLQKARMVR